MNGATPSMTRQIDNAEEQRQKQYNEENGIIMTEIPKIKRGAFGRPIKVKSTPNSESMVLTNISNVG